MDQYNEVINITKFKKLLEIYNSKYKDLPDDEDELLRLVMDKYHVDESKLKEAVDSIDNIEWKEFEFTLPLIPNPSPRPRHTKSGHTYVEGAQETKDYFRNYIKKRFDDHISDLVIDSSIIHTIVDIHLDFYIPTPVSSMNKTEIILAQMKKIRPIGSGDWDNLAKTYCDMIQDILIYNDNIIASGSVEKFYSLKPKVLVKIRYQSDFDCKYNKRKVLDSKSYKKLIES